MFVYQYNSLGLLKSLKFMIYTRLNKKIVELFVSCNKALIIVQSSNVLYVKSIKLDDLKN